MTEASPFQTQFRACEAHIVNLQGVTFPRIITSRSRADRKAGTAVRKWLRPPAAALSTCLAVKPANSTRMIPLLKGTIDSTVKGISFHFAQFQYQQFIQPEQCDTTEESAHLSARAIESTDNQMSEIPRAKRTIKTHFEGKGHWRQGGNDSSSS